MADAWDGSPVDPGPPDDPLGHYGRDDRALLAAHVDGDPEAFGILFARHRDRLWAVAPCTPATPRRPPTRQDGMVSAFRRGHLLPWRRRGGHVAAGRGHPALDRIRRRKVRAADALPDDLDEYAAAARGSSTDPGTGLPRGPADLVVDEERRAAVLRALATLAPEQRAALVLVDMQGYPVEEAARILGCPTGTVKSRCARGRARLAPLLVGLRSGNPPPGPRVQTRTDPADHASSPSAAPAEGGDPP